MTSRSLRIPFFVSLVLAPLASLIAWKLGGAVGGDVVVKIVFIATVVVEVVALLQAIEARRLFERGDPGYLTWTLIVGFLTVRILAELRLLSITFVPALTNVKGGSQALFFYVVVLRYLYTISDVLFVGALVTTIRAYRMTGLKFGLLTRDYFYIFLLAVVPVTTYLFRSNLGMAGIINSDDYIAAYRLLAVFVGAIIGCLCLVVRRYVAQMGGGAIAGVWNGVVIAGISRDASFMALALFSRSWFGGAAFAEQYLLWIFAAYWLFAAMRQREAIPQAPDGALGLQSALHIFAG